MRRLSNYPPGVSGNEPEIVGESARVGGRRRVCEGTGKAAVRGKGDLAVYPCCSVCGRDFGAQGRKAQRRFADAWASIPRHYCEALVEHEIFAAVIERKGRCREDGYSEPYARLEDGRLMPMGWNAMGEIFEVGTVGTAQYVSTSAAGLWKFRPVEAAS